MTHAIATLATLAMGAALSTGLVHYLRSNRDRIGDALQGRTVRPHD